MKALTFLCLLGFFLCSSCGGGEKQTNSPSADESEVSSSEYHDYDERTETGEEGMSLYAPYSSSANYESQETDYSEGVIN